jgi:hypothetical protein
LRTMPVPLMPAFVFAAGRMLAGATPLRLMPVPLTCAELGESPIPLLGVAPLVPVLGFAKTIGLFVCGVRPETGLGECGPTTDRAVAAAPVGNLNWGGLFMTLGALPLAGGIGEICGPLFSAGVLGAEDGFVNPLRALGPLAVALDDGAGCAAMAAIVEIPLAMRVTSTYLAAHALEGPTCRRMALLQRSARAKLMNWFMAVASQ